MNRLIVLNRFFYPDHSATSQILTDLRLHFAASGVDVHVITSQQLYDDPSRQLPAKATTAQMRTFRAAERDPPRPTRATTLMRTSESLRVAKLHPRVSSSSRNSAWL